MNKKELITELNAHSSELADYGISIKDIVKQLEIFSSGALFTRIQRPCRINDGIKLFNDADKDNLLQNYNSAAGENRLIKFVPASGAATRMFKNILAYLSENDSIEKASHNQDAQSNSNTDYIHHFINNIQNFAFYKKLKSVLIRDNISEEDVNLVLKRVIDETGLNYANYPKGAILFHSYGGEYRTAFEEHLFEAAALCTGNNSNVKIHFTISEEHEKLFNQIINKAVRKPELNNFKFDISYSFQKKSTDTISLTEDNQLLKDENGQIVLRPAGHGALIENLNDLKADIVIIKNIDNILPSNKNETSIYYKKLMIGYLNKIQSKIFKYLELLETQNCGDTLIDEITEFSATELLIDIPDNFNNLPIEQKAEYLFEKLNRPLRICGMVKNEGEPGGGPFWVLDNKSSPSLQIVEQAQINRNDADQIKIFNDSTHFNPVDIVCGLKDYKGNNFNLKTFIDETTGLITRKSYGGINIKTLELPGLWNGGMAYWNTIFTEIPVETFNPVKTVNDLLKPGHQSD